VNTAVVVGGGIAGILSALVLKERYERVVLVEKSPACGGLLRSIVVPNGLRFDYGTHFGRDTGEPELDRLLYGDIIEETWHKFQVIQVGNYYRGKLDETSLFIDANALGKERHSQGVGQLMACDPPPQETTNLDAFYRSNYGNLFTDELLLPVIEKLFGCEATELAPGARHLFGLSRMRAFTSEMTRELKQTPFFDEKLAFHSYREGQSGKFNYYPKAGGIGGWPDLLVERMKQGGVEILTGHGVEEVLHSNGRATGVRLDSGDTIECDRLVWTLAPALCLRAAGIPFESRPPRLLSTVLLNFAFDRPFLTRLYYFVCYAPEFRSYRTTLYSNIETPVPKPGLHYCTVEVVHTGDEDLAALQARIPGELRTMGVLDGAAQIEYQDVIDLPRCIPVMTTDFATDSARQLGAAKEAFDNVHFLGKAGGQSFFIHEVLLQTWRELREASVPVG